LISLVLVAGCTNNQEKKLVGRWQETTNPKGALEFYKNHTGRAYWPGESGKQETSAMKWQILAGENKVSVITPPGPVNFEITTNGLVSPNGLLLTKVK
jgi:hypothetical protein